MSSACPDCTSRTLCVKHAGELARRSVDRYLPRVLRPEDWEPIAEFTRALAHDLHPRDDRGAVEAADVVAGSVLGPPRGDSA